MIPENANPVVHLVDDDASFLRATSRLLRASGIVVHTYSSGSEFLARLTADTLGCVVVDLSMPGIGGLDLQDALANRECVLPIIFLTGHGDIPSSVRAMRHGAEDFLTKRAPKEQLLSAIERALTRGVRERELRLRLQKVREKLDQLTPREREVLQGVVQGKLNKQIADDLSIHERTVKLHRTNITTKLQVHSVAELTRLVMEAERNAGRSPAILQ